MPKAKVARKSTSIDMAPMVDLAFLLLTFFMLATKFAPSEAVQIVTPSSTYDKPLPPQDIMQISISKEGRVFFGVDSKFDKRKIAEKINTDYQLDLSPDDMDFFSIQPEFGLPIKFLKQWIQAPSNEERKKIELTGIPCDSTDNELARWLMWARTTNTKLRIVIKGDQDAPYPVVKKVIATLQDKNVNKFNLITGKEDKNAESNKVSKQ